MSDVKMRAALALADDAFREAMREAGAKNYDRSLYDLIRAFVSSHDRYRRAARWSHVSERSGHGSGFSAALCRAFDLDPDEMVGGIEADETEDNDDD